MQVSIITFETKDNGWSVAEKIFSDVKPSSSIFPQTRYISSGYTDEKTAEIAANTIASLSDQNVVPPGACYVSCLIPSDQGFLPILMTSEKISAESGLAKCFTDVLDIIANISKPHSAVFIDIKKGSLVRKAN